jgi:hypothetical protein
VISRVSVTLIMTGGDIVLFAALPPVSRSACPAANVKAAPRAADRAPAPKKAAVPRR